MPNIVRAYIHMWGLTCRLPCVQVSEALAISSKTLQKIKQNLTWAFAYNLVAIPLAAGALLPSHGIALTPSIAGKLGWHNHNVMPLQRFHCVRPAHCSVTNFMASPCSSEVCNEACQCRGYDGIQLPRGHGKLDAATS